MSSKTFWVGAAITVAVTLAQALTEFDPAVITDWRAWAVWLAAASVRQVAVYVAARLGSAK